PTLRWGIPRQWNHAWRGNPGCALPRGQLPILSGAIISLQGLTPTGGIGLKFRAKSHSLVQHIMKSVNSPVFFSLSRRAGAARASRKRLAALTGGLCILPAALCLGIAPGQGDPGPAG